MSRDAWGAEWGRYLTHVRQQRRLQQKRRTLRLDAIYLLQRVDTKLVWFGGSQLIVKVGRSVRSPFRRATEMGSQRYQVFAYWQVARENLAQAELDALHAMRNAFSAPCDGREAFYVDSAEHARLVVETSITPYVLTEKPIDLCSW